MMDLNISEYGTGVYAQPSVNGSVIAFAGIDGSVDIESLQVDHAIKLRATMDRLGSLSIDPDRDYWLVAVIGIPAASYVEQETGETDLEGNPVYERVREPIGAVEVTLWPLP